MMFMNLKLTGTHKELNFLCMYIVVIEWVRKTTHVLKHVTDKSGIFVLEIYYK